MDKSASLTPTVRRIVRDKGTEPAYSGQYQTPPEQAGTYLCRQCGLALFRGSNQFTSHCGWPSFDDQIPHTITESSDADGRRTEILCQRCAAHLGHVFVGEKLTARNVRHCVNSLAIEFVANKEVLDSEEAILAAGCFWGVQYYLDKFPGVLKTEVGYTGGRLAAPTYHEVCQHHTGHLEAIRVVYDPQKIDYEALVKYFFEIHDPTQNDGQGPDRGPQYLSAVFYFNAQQKTVAESVIQILKNKGYAIATQLKPVSVFWPAETVHQHYYQKSGDQPYCHRHVKRF